MWDNLGMGKWRKEKDVSYTDNLFVQLFPPGLIAVMVSIRRQLLRWSYGFMGPLLWSIHWKMCAAKCNQIFRREFLKIQKTGCSPDTQHMWLCSPVCSHSFVQELLADTTHRLQHERGVKLVNFSLQGDRMPKKLQKPSIHKIDLAQFLHDILQYVSILNPREQY